MGTREFLNLDCTVKKKIKANKMSEKPTYEALALRVKALEMEIAERADTEQALKDSQRLLQTLIDTIEGEVFVKDTNGKYLFVNKAFGERFRRGPEGCDRKR